MIKVKGVSAFTSCDSCGKEWDKSFRKVYIAGGARYIVTTVVLCGSCIDSLKEMI